MSDMSGELSESQKIERENMQDKLAQQVKQIAIQRETIDMLTLELEKVKEKLKNVPEKLPKVGCDHFTDSYASLVAPILIRDHQMGKKVKLYGLLPYQHIATHIATHDTTFFHVFLPNHDCDWKT